MKGHVKQSPLRVFVEEGCSSHYGCCGISGKAEPKVEQKAELKIKLQVKKELKSMNFHLDQMLFLEYMKHLLPDINFYHMAHALLLLLSRLVPHIQPSCCDRKVHFDEVHQAGELKVFTWWCGSSLRLSVLVKSVLKCYSMQSAVYLRRVNTSSQIITRIRQTNLTKISSSDLFQSSKQALDEDLLWQVSVSSIS